MRNTYTLSGIRRMLMRQLQDTVSDWRRPSWKDLSWRDYLNFLLNLFSFAIVTYCIWGFDYIDGLYNSVVLNLFAAMLPSSTFIEVMSQKPEGRRFSWENAVLTSFLALALVLAFSEKFGLDGLRLNVGMMMLSYPWLVIFWIFVRDKNILAIGMVPAALLLIALWIDPAFYSEFGLHYVLISFTTVSLVAAVWTGLVWTFFKGVDRWSCRPALGPFMEFLAMLSLFFPLMALVVRVPRAIPGGDDWSVIIPVIVGVVFGSVVSEPLRRFLRSFGNLPSYPRLGENNDTKERRDTEG